METAEAVLGRAGHLAEGVNEKAARSLKVRSGAMTFKGHRPRTRRMVTGTNA